MNLIVVGDVWRDWTGEPAHSLALDLEASSWSCWSMGGGPLWMSTSGDTPNADRPSLTRCGTGSGDWAATDLAPSRANLWPEGRTAPATRGQ
jgi:hypothetical protein